MVLILYAMLSVSVRMTLSGVGLIDSMPIALYILPLMIFLPLMIQAFYKSRTAAWNFFFLIVASIFFGMLSLLIHGFILCVMFNIAAVISIFILGRFRPQGSLRAAGKKSIAYIILLNMLGLTFPISIIIMGQVPIAQTESNRDATIMLTVPLADFEFPYDHVDPSSVIGNISENQFGLNFRVLENDLNSWTRLSNWLIAINATNIPYSITLTADRASMVGASPEIIGSTDVIQGVFQSHRSALGELTISLENITNRPEHVLFDMRLSIPEWQKLMFHVRSLDLVGFAGLMRGSIYSTDISVIEQETSLLLQDAESAGVSPGLVIESFVVDDMQDNDNVAMRLSGVSLSFLSSWDMIEVSSSRSRFSIEMNGDVGEYLVESYSKSVGLLGSNYSIRIGEAGSTTDIEGRTEVVYEALDILGNDIALATGNGVSQLTIESLPSLLTSFGPDVLSNLHELLDSRITALATYTFRIYAYRAVFIAIDSFDLIML